MASHRIETYCQRLAFPIGALIFSRGIDRLVRAGRLDPIPYFRRHTRGDWGDVNVCQWHANGVALQSGASLESHYVIHPGLAIRIITDAGAASLPSCCRPKTEHGSPAGHSGQHLQPPSAARRFPSHHGHAIARWWCMPHFHWSITMSFDLETTAADAAPVQGELLDAESSL